MRAPSIIGRKFNRLLVIGEGSRAPGGQPRLRCLCDCGNYTDLVRQTILSGNTKSCGCWKRESSWRQSHGGANHPAYKAYHQAKQRCTNPNNPRWDIYGGRGIEFRLPPFDEFWEVMRPSWFEGATIERSDNDGHYELGNVRWATRKEQSRNRSNTQPIEFGGRRMHLKDWAVELGVAPSTLTQRLQRGWSLEQTLTTPAWGTRRRR